MRDFFHYRFNSTLQKSLLYFSHDSADLGTLIPPFFLLAFHIVLYSLTIQIWNSCCERWEVISDSYLKAWAQNNLVTQRAAFPCSVDLYSILVTHQGVYQHVYFPTYGHLGMPVYWTTLGNSHPLQLKKSKHITHYDDIWGFLLPNVLRSLSFQNCLFIQNLVITDTEI